MRFLVVGNPENRRVDLFREAVRRGGHPEPDVVAYEDLLAGETLASRLSSETVVRLDSPGENPRVEAALIDRGSTPNPPTRSLEHGEIAFHAQWYRGFRDLLRQLREEVARTGARWTSHPDEIAELFDKSACHARLRDRGTSVARTLGTATSYEELRDTMREQRAARVFVKLRYGSSASGVVALETRRERVQATTSTELVAEGARLRLFNSLRIRRYREEHDVALLVDALCREGVQVEEWFPKAGWNGATCDLRILIVAGAPRHAVLRTSRGPLTNLHLGNRRGNVEGFLAQLPPDSREELDRTCRRVAEAFPRCLHLGVDVAFAPGLRRHVVLEVNAFGDLLPGVRHRGENTYEAQVAALARWC